MKNSDHFDICFVASLSNAQQLQMIQWDHLLNAYTKSFEKLTFLTPSYVQMFVTNPNIKTFISVHLIQNIVIVALSGVLLF